MTAVSGIGRASAGSSLAWDKPMCLIENTADTDLHLNQETLARLREVTVPVVSVSIVGMYRTGKSYLMNILADKNDEDVTTGGELQGMANYLMRAL